MANNEHRAMSLLLNDNKGVVTTGQINYYVYPRLNYLRLCGVDNKIQSLNIDFWIKKHLQNVTSYTSLANTMIYLSTTGTNDLESTQWKNAKTLFEENTTFIWGSLDKGGLFIRYDNSNFDIRFGCVSGLYYNGVNKYIYKIQQASSADGKSSDSYNTIQYIIPAYLYERGTTNTNMDGGTYINAIGLLYNRNLQDLSGKIPYYNLQAGMSIGSFEYSELNKNEAYNVNEIPWKNGWTPQNVGSKVMLCDVGVNCNAVLTNGIDTVCFDNVNNEVDGYVRMSGWWYGDSSVTPDDMDDGGINTPQGGGGTWDTTNTPVKPSDPTRITNDAFGTGFVNCYNPSSSELQQLAQFLFSGITKNVANMLKKLMANPMDYIVGLNMCHFNVTSTSATSVKFGGVDTGVVMNVVDKQFKVMNGGSIQVPERSGSFLDYAPNTRCKIFVPYCGIHELPIDLIEGGTLHLRYIIDCLTGALVAELCLKRDRNGWLQGVEKLSQIARAIITAV